MPKVTFEIDFTEDEANDLADFHGYHELVHNPEDPDAEPSPNSKSRVQYLSELGRSVLAPFLAAAALKTVEDTFEIQKQEKKKAASQAVSDRIVVTET